MKPTCSDCFHSAACGSSSPYCDVPRCKQFLLKDSVVSAEILHSVESERDKYKTLYYEALNCANELSKEMRDLRIIKQTLEMASGTKFNF